MSLNILDWISIGVFVLITIYIGLRFASRAGESLGEFFLSGRKLPWYIAGFSMVATTFAADTPLAVTEIVNKQGIAGNWFWWNMLIGGMFTTLFFAKNWRRAEILTDVEFVELRYSGKPAAFLRGFKAIYLGIFMNSIIIGWVNIALATILRVFFDIPEEQVLYYVAAAMIITAIYSSVSGLWGVALTDFIQFLIAITGCIVLAFIVVNSPEIGGIQGMKEKLPEGSLRFLPEIGNSDNMLGGLTISIGTFLAFIGVQWWASWYPGSEPGGGGYIAQRMMSAKDEKNSLWATLFFQVAHYCIRPWPWILVGLCTIILYPHLPEADKKLGYVMAMRDFLPPGLKGLLLVTFLAAYMSTISTQLNWGASYLINDFYKRFIKKDQAFASEAKAQKHYVLASRIFTLVAMAVALYVTTQINSIREVWAFVVECGAGLGLVLILRWYWWRVNAWSEITATVVPFIVFGFIKSTAYFGNPQTENSIAFFQKLYIGNESLFTFPGSFFIIVGITTVSWLIITFITQPEKMETLIHFYNRITPQGSWKPVLKAMDLPVQKSTIPSLVLAWGGALLLTYSLMFFIGKFILQEWQTSLFLIISASIGGIILWFGMRRGGLF